MENTKPLINRSNEVVDNFTLKNDTTHATAYARAFGAAWALLSDEQKIKLIAFSEKRKVERN